ncbi:MAG: DUF429 domain-containing protein [Crenarchaeota archaeon]|nr:DUF429 domain-containing protein [Thermoproteota archaeon]
MVIVAGLDLRARSDKPTGIAFLEDNKLVFVSKTYTDEEIIMLINRYNPLVIAIDAPLSHAKGFREVDKKMIRQGYRVLPPGWKSMKKLVSRALRIKNLLDSKGIHVIETHPRSSLKSSGCSIEKLLARIGIDKERIRRLSRDEIDAVIAALTAYHYARGEYISVKDVDGEIILLPRICST